LAVNGLNTMGKEINAAERATNAVTIPQEDLE